MNKEQTNAKGGLEFRQGLQLFFVSKILDERYTMASVAGSNRGIEFFSQWSKIVCQGRTKDTNFPLIVKVTSDFGKPTGEKPLPKIATKKEVDLEDGAKVVPTIATINEVDSTRTASEQSTRALDDMFMQRSETDLDLSFAPPDYHPLLKNPSFINLLHLLSDEDLGKLMQIPYPTEVEEVMVVLGTTKDADIIHEAIARQLKKKRDEVTPDDYRDVTELDLSNSSITDIEPVKDMHNLQELNLNRCKNLENLEPLRNLTSLQVLILDNTRVSDLLSIKGLTSLQRLWLSKTKVADLSPLTGLTKLQQLWLVGCKKLSDEQIEQLEKALPECEIKK